MQIFVRFFVSYAKILALDQYFLVIHSNLTNICLILFNKFFFIKLYTVQLTEKMKKKINPFFGGGSQGGGKFDSIVIQLLGSSGELLNIVILFRCKCKL